MEGKVCSAVDGWGPDAPGVTLSGGGACACQRMGPRLLMQMEATHADEGPACSAEMRVHASGWGRACSCR